VANDHDRKVIENILRVGTSAGGRRAKAILAWNPRDGAFRVWTVEAGSGFEYWLMKFDGVVQQQRIVNSPTPKGSARSNTPNYLNGRRCRN